MQLPWMIMRRRQVRTSEFCQWRHSYYITASNMLDTLQILKKPSLLWEVLSVSNTNLIQHMESLPYVDCQWRRCVGTLSSYWRICFLFSYIWKHERQRKWLLISCSAHRSHHVYAEYNIHICGCTSRCNWPCLEWHGILGPRQNGAPKCDDLFAACFGRDGFLCSIDYSASLVWNGVT